MKAIVIGGTGTDVSVRFEKIVNIPEGTTVEVQRPRKQKTDQQRKIYFAFLDWCIRHGLKNKGHYSVDAVHNDIKEWVRDVHRVDFRPEWEFSELTEPEFRFYFDLVNLEFMIEFMELDTSQFWEDYEQYMEWSKANHGTFAEWEVYAKW